MAEKVANELLAPIHDRMPVILHHKDYAQWLDPSFSTVETLEKLLVPFEAKKMEAFPVSTAVNSPRNQGKELVDPVESS